ncbi:MAG: DUF4194 domain-containing protein [Clostridium sp.]
MIDYYEALSGAEQAQVSESIRLLYRQTFLLERTYDRKSKRYQTSPEFYQCSQHLEFIRSYFAIMGIEVVENSQLGLIYIRGEQIVGEKLSKLATLYVLILKLIYDEQMSSVSTSVNVVTTLSEINEKIGSYRLLKKHPSVSEIRRSLAFLKKYQVIEPLDVLEDLDGFSRLVIYPTVNVILMGDDVRALLETFREGEEEDGESEI